MFRLYANAAQTEAIKSAATFLVVVRRDTGYGVSPSDFYAPVYANRWVKDYAIAHGGNIHKISEVTHA